MAFAELENGVISVQTQWTEKDLIKQAPGARWNSKTKAWTLPLGWGSCMVLRGLFTTALELGPKLIEWATIYREKRVDPALALRNSLARDFGVLLNDSEKLYDFQRAGVEFMYIAGDVLLGDEMGTGKTIQGLLDLKQYEDVLPALIICPNSVKRHWDREIKKWYPEATPYIVESGVTKRRKIIEAAKKDPTAIVIINIEAMPLTSRLASYGSVRLVKCGICDPKFGDHELKPTRCDVHPKELNDFGFKTVILDEAHRIKEPKAKQTRATWAVMHGPTVERRVGLTGTPIAQHPGDLWSIMHAIAPYDFPTKSKYVDRYCLQTWNAYGGIDIVGVRPDTREELFAILDPHFRRMTKAMVLPQLPMKVRSTRYVELTPTQRRMYKELDDTLVTRTDDGELFIAKSELAAQTRLMQLSSATVKIEKPDPNDLNSWIVTLHDPSPKLDELEVVLEELGDTKCVVAAESKKLINLTAQRLEKKRIRYALITGDVSPFDRDRALTMLNNNEIRVLLFTVKAGGTGVDMSSADTLINLQRSWSLVDALQTEDRVHRIGSERHQKIRIIDIVARDTVEETQIDRLYIKLMRLEEITRDRARLIAMGVDTSQLDQEEALILATHLGTPLGRI